MNQDTRWIPASTPPEPLIDVLLHQVIPWLDPDDNTLTRIGYIDSHGIWVDTYTGEAPIEVVTHWMPLPSSPTERSPA